ncbi:hypothetical protein IAR55_000265 [Kwoniella newhampshirensis]|uniref:Secreted protein n=1 Tax=Kwoniella newhampshirensis TaxID=1651941 RepID=A0AAW0Z647_9TREE
MLFTLLSAFLTVSTSLADAKPVDVSVLAGAPINNLNLTLSPTEVVQCTNLTLSWGTGDAGTAPYRLAIGSGGYYSNLTWSYEYDNITSTQLDWTVSAPAGESLIFELWDTTNTTTYTQNHLVQPGNATCLPSDDLTSNSITESNSTIVFVSAILETLEGKGSN